MSHPQLKNPWFPGRVENPHAALNLFCFPYAGGGVQVFSRWQAAFPPGRRVQVYPAQYPGRASRLLEPPFEDCRALVEALAPFILPLTERPFAFFGHSMGAIVAFELARLLRERHGREPVRLFVSGRRAPQVPTHERPTYGLPDAEFVGELRRLNGTPREVLEHPELMRLMLPIIRADLRLTQSYAYEPGPPLGYPLTVFGGADDPDVPREHLAAWCEHTTAPCTLRMFPGGHFFLNAAAEELVRAIERELP
jgi:medium-chain acyl-[acyl-carrier-protein] hydrolase